VRPHRASLETAVERHLLLAALGPTQRESLLRHGWFDLPWPEQLLVLRVHTRLLPTVDAYQPAHQYQPADAGQQGTYLTSWDLRALAHPVHQAGQRAAHAFRVSRPAPLALARLVLEARRRGALRPLLESALPVRVTEASLVDR
jgi:hypothetical protein